MKKVERLAINKTITLVSKKNTKIIDLAKMIIKLTKSKSKIIFDKKNKRFDDFSSKYPYNKDEKNIINWQPKYDLKNGLEQYIRLKRKLY